MGAGCETELVRIAAGVGLFEGAEAEDAADQRPEMRGVCNDDSGRGFAHVPIEVNKGAVRRGKVSDSIEGCAEDLRVEN